MNRHPDTSHRRDDIEAPITLLGVWAHPDDETYLSGILMRRVVLAGGRVVLVSATRGERGTADESIPPHALAERRELELRTAMQTLGVEDVRFLGIPDGQCSDRSGDAEVETLAAMISDVRPDLIVTFGPDGITRHPDHMAVGRWATTAWHVSRDRSNGRWSGGALRYAAMTETFVDRSERLYPDLPLTLVGSPATIPDEAVTLHVRANAGERRIKARALAAHESQVASIIDVVGSDRFYDWWVDETFRTPTSAEIAGIVADAAAVGPPHHRIGSLSQVRTQRLGLTRPRRLSTSRVTNLDDVEVH